MTMRHEPRAGGSAAAGLPRTNRRAGDVNDRAALHPSRVIILNCFGRGGSSILWNMLGSSPDVIMTSAEWHQAVFGAARRTRRLTTRAFWALGLPFPLPLRQHAHRALLAARQDDDVRDKPPGAAIVTKVMDYHLTFNPMIASEFDESSFVVLTRHPWGQCESLMRSGLRADQACRWYNDVATRMARVLDGARSVQVRFERLMKAPVRTCDELYQAIGISWRPDRRFRYKVKRFGADRRGNGDFAEDRFEWIGPGEAEAYIDGTVVESAVERLEPDARSRIWKRTRAAAEALGYTDDCAGGVE